MLGSVAVVLLVRVKDSWRDERTRLLLWFALPLWAMVSAQAINSNANANWAAPAFAPATIAAVAWLLQRGKKNACWSSGWRSISSWSGLPTTGSRRWSR